MWVLIFKSQFLKLFYYMQMTTFSLKYARVHTWSHFLPYPTPPPPHITGGSGESGLLADDLLMKSGDACFIVH